VSILEVGGHVIAFAVLAVAVALALDWVIGRR